MRKLEESLVKQALTSEEYAEYKQLSARVAENSRSIPTLLEAGVPLEDWWPHLASAVEPRLADAHAAAAADRREKNAAEMPWVHRASPAQMLKDIERLSWFNERIRSFAHQMTVKHAVLGEALESQAVAARALLERQQRALGVVFTAFVRRLKDAGLKTQSVKDLSNDAIMALVEALNGEHEVDLLSVLGVRSSHRRLSDTEMAELDAEQARLDAELLDLQAYTANAVSSNAPEEPVSAPPVEHQFESWDYQNGPLPREWWSAAQETPASYEWRYRRIRPDEEDTILGMELPEAHDWAALRRWDRLFAELSLEGIRFARGADNNIRDLLSAKQGCDPDEIDGNLARAWVFLLGARVMAQTTFTQLFKPRHFEGIVVPCYASGPDVVRELLWTGDE